MKIQSTRCNFTHRKTYTKTCEQILTKILNLKTQLLLKKSYRMVGNDYRSLFHKRLDVGKFL